MPQINYFQATSNLTVTSYTEDSYENDAIYIMLDCYQTDPQPNFRWSVLATYRDQPKFTFVEPNRDGLWSISSFPRTKPGADWREGIGSDRHCYLFQVATGPTRNSIDVIIVAILERCENYHLDQTRSVFRLSGYTHRSMVLDALADTFRRVAGFNSMELECAVMYLAQQARLFDHARPTPQAPGMGFYRAWKVEVARNA
ncbi:hypothetical protein F4821DRAFT_222968 [Hypoxylon rubiginosum]|uniref:Uncharacterized protein n=1 Tax=Hypoxylon rubiginosum TaxID=110542 RepID=A0ACC0DIU5_9PEZI|nr:hypothetical protein F4821DRAFT_222968 [Hypoxylon rubiginosum]